MIPTDRFEHVEVASTSELETWLAAHHAQHEAIWLVTYKRAVPGKYVSRDEVLDLLVAFGWIDGIRRHRDEQRTMQLVSPRRTKPWAKTYKDRATFEAFPASTRRNILRWIAHAKTPSTRAKRIDRVTRDAHTGIRTKTNG